MSAPQQPNPPFPRHALALLGDDGKPAVINRKPGRPRKVRPAPSADEREWARQVAADRDAFVEADDLVCAIQRGEGTPEIVRAVLLDLAVESAALRLEIRSAHAAARSDGIEKMMSRRIDALHKMASVMLEAAKLNLIENDLGSQQVQRVFDLFVETLADAARETIPDPDTFVARCKEALVGWEDRVPQPQA